MKYLKCQFTTEYKQADGTSRTRAITSGVEYVHVNSLMKGLNIEDESAKGVPSGSDNGLFDPSV